MTRALAVEWHVIQDAIYQWACQATEIDWVWSDQDTAQQRYPYGVISPVSGLAKTGIDEVRWVPPVAPETKGRNVHTGPRVFTLGFDVQVGEPDSNSRPDMSAHSILSTLQATTGFVATSEILFPANVAIIEELPIVPLGQFIGSNHISRAQMDIRFGTQSCIEEAIDQIDVMEITIEISNHPAQGGTDTLDLT